VNKKFNISIFYILFFLAAVFLSGFVLLELREDFLAVLGSIAVLLISAYLLIDKLHEDILFYLSELKNGTKTTDETEKEKLAPYLDEIQKIEKATYTATKKNAIASEDHYKDLLIQVNRISDELQQLMQATEKGVENVPGKQLIQIQQQILDQDAENYRYQTNALKAIVKYNKENAKQIAENANSNAQNILKQSETDTDRILEGLHLLGEQVVQLSMIQERINDRIDKMQESGMQIIREEAVKAVPLPEATRVSAPIPEPISEPTPEPIIELESETFPEPSAASELILEPEPLSEPEPVLKSAPAPEAKPEPKPEPTPAPKAEIPVPSGDPNKSLSADEIAAMFAAAATPAPEAKPEPKPEPAPAPKAEIPVPSGDPNKSLSADEIAAMFAAAATPAPEAKPEAAPAPKAEIPVPSGDPNKSLSADEIAAMFAAAATPAPEAKPEPAPAPKAEIPVPSGDPNKSLSADEIAAMFAAANMK